MKGLAKSKPESKQEKAPEQDTDTRLVNMMGEEAVDAGADKIQGAIQRAQNPGIALGQVVGQMALQIGQTALDELEVSPTVFLKPGGFVEHTIDYAVQQYGLPEEVKQPAFVSAVELLKAVNQSGQQQQAGQQPQAQPPQAGLAQQQPPMMGGPMV